MRIRISLDLTLTERRAIAMSQLDDAGKAMRHPAGKAEAEEFIRRSIVKDVDRWLGIYKVRGGL